MAFTLRKRTSVGKILFNTLEIGPGWDVPAVEITPLAPLAIAKKRFLALLEERTPAILKRTNEAITLRFADLTWHGEHSPISNVQ